MKGLKLSCDGSFSPSTGVKTGKIKADLKHDIATITTDCDLNMAGPLVQGAMVIGHNGWLAGYQVIWGGKRMVT